MAGNLLIPNVAFTVGMPLGSDTLESYPVLPPVASTSKISPDSLTHN